MIPDGHHLEDYLGKFSKCRKKFQFSCGQKILLKVIAEACKKLLNTSENELNPGIPNSTVNQPQITSKDAQACALAIFKAKKEHLTELTRSLSYWIKNQNNLIQV